MKILVCGGRDYRDERAVRTVLDAALRTGPVEILHGGAKGADRFAKAWAFDRGVPAQEFLADWETHQNAAGPIRNSRMLKEGRPHMVLAFPGGRGTADMVKQASRAGVLVVRFPPSEGNKLPFDLE